MTLARGSIEMISLAHSQQPKSFGDFTQIFIGRRKLSSATVSKRLRELVAIKALEEVVIKSKSGRRTVGYRTTERGEKILEIAKEFDRAIRAAKK